MSAYLSAKRKQGSPIRLTFCVKASNNFLTRMGLPRPITREVSCELCPYKREQVSLPPPTPGCDVCGGGQCGGILQELLTIQQPPDTILAVSAPD